MRLPKTFHTFWRGSRELSFLSVTELRHHYTIQNMILTTWLFRLELRFGVSSSKVVDNHGCRNRTFCPKIDTGLACFIRDVSIGAKAGLEIFRRSQFVRQRSAIPAPDKSCICSSRRHVRATCRGSSCEQRRIFKHHATTCACSGFVTALTQG